MHLFTTQASTLESTNAKSKPPLKRKAELDVRKIYKLVINNKYTA